MRTAVAGRAAAFAGWYFAAPAWHNGWFLADDANQDAIWFDLPEELERHAEPIGTEVDQIAAWFDSGHRYYDVFKIGRASQFLPAGARGLPQTSANDDQRQNQLKARTA
ncbi:MAG: hypothetical protein HC909_00505 [Blastochloris sp.]|nr:hypothetical protein [Blastochloris sp.]